MAAIIEFGYNDRPVFTGVDKLERRLRGLDESVITSQKKLASAAAASASALAAAEGRKSALQQNNGRLHLALLEAQLSGNAKEARSIEYRINLLRQMRQIQQQTNVSQREAYALAQHQLARPSAAAGTRGFAISNVAFQAQDIAVQLQAGTRASIVLAQQGSQLLSFFGPGAAIAGGVLAIGGAFYTMGERARDAFKEAQEAQREFEDKGRDAVANGSVASLIQFTDLASRRVSDLELQLSQMWEKRSLADVISEWSGGPSLNEKSAQQEEQLQRSRDLQQKTTEIMIAAAEREARIAGIRAQGRDHEAEQLERQLKLAQEWARISQMDLTPEQRDRYTAAVENKLAAEQQKADAEIAKKKQDDIDRLAQSQQTLDERKLQAALEDMSLAKRIAILNVEAQRALAEENRLKGDSKRDEVAIFEAGSKRVALQRDINQLQRQYATEKEREAEAAKREAEQAARKAEADAKNAQTRRNAVLDTALEYKLLEAKAAGRKKEVEEIERQARILERARRLEDQNGLGKKEALALATRMTDLEDRANGQRRRIGRATNAIDDPQGRHGLSGRPSGPLSRTGPLYNSRPLSRNGGLPGFWDLQAGNIGRQSTMSDYYLQNTFSTSPSLQEHHARNAARANDTGGSSGNAAVDSFLDRLISRLPPALADAILSKT